ncbi:MAG: hypothetical protein FRX48_05333 [Lasallia pustulata]|uniref:Uncharacterized protein n=1 Tax=Lasallia pustulata TaxID=136370 RepID=A0A5M8PQ01_9LECA|nr:MAG: hypothetical protein FRX48_05333 [Lasallia pustulata]
MAPYKNNVTLLNLLSQYPIVRAIAQELPFAGLLNLARLNSEYRNILHGFPWEAMGLDHCMDRNGARQVEWYAQSQSIPKGRIQEVVECAPSPSVRAASSKHPLESTKKPFRTVDASYALSVGPPAIRFAKAPSNPYMSASPPDLQAKPKICAGQSCSNLLDETEEELRACLWCHLPLEGRPSLGESRRDYDSRHLYARSNSNTWSFDDVYFPSANNQLSNGSSSAGNRKRSIIPYSDQRYSPSKNPPIKKSVSFPFSSPPKLKVRAPRPLPNLMLIDYASLGVPPPTALRMVDSVFGTFCYDPDFLLAFRPLCRKEPTPDWEVRLVNAILQSNGTGLVTEGDDDDEVLVLDEGEGSDEATLHPYDADDNDDDSDEATLATARISSDCSFMSRGPWV